MSAPIPPETIRAPRDLAPFLEHTLLAPDATPADLARLCAEARRHGLGAVCVRRQAVPEARRLLEATPVKTVAVVDFPEGLGTTPARVAEALEAARAGAVEVDVVAPQPALLSGRWEAVLDDLRAVIRAVDLHADLLRASIASAVATAAMKVIREA